MAARLSDEICNAFIRDAIDNASCMRVQYGLCVGMDCSPWEYRNGPVVPGCIRVADSPKQGVQGVTDFHWKFVMTALDTLINKSFGDQILKFH